MVRWALIALAWPSIAWGSAAPLPLAGLRAQPEPIGDEVEGAPPEPTSSKAPEDMPPPPPEEESTKDAEAATPPGEPDATLHLTDERKMSPRRREFNRHGVGLRGGVVVVPTWILARWVETQTNALCRGDTVGNFARERGLLKTQGCNFYIGGEYVYRQSRILDIVGVLGYQRLHTPDSMWLDKGQAAVNGLGGADYTEVRMNIMMI